MLHGLVRRRDPARRAVVVRAVVQPGAAPGGGVDQPGDRRGAVGAEHRRRRLDLELEAQRPAGSPSSQRTRHHRLDLRHRAHLAVFGSLPGFVTVHPSYLLRIPDKRESAAAYGAFVSDLRKIAELVA